MLARQTSLNLLSNSLGSLLCSAALVFVAAMGLVKPAHAWGEIGHDVMSRVAAQQLQHLSGDNQAFTRPFKSRDHMLAHLSNVPDIVWRSPAMTEQERSSNSPTHYINLEPTYGAVDSIEDLATGYAEHVTRSRAVNVEDVLELGSLPWRILQLQQMMVASLRAAKQATTPKEMIDATNQVLLYAGIMSHFVGDMANPHHTSVNHDGQLTGNKGLHAYFESDIVMALPLDLIAQVNATAGPDLLNATVFKGLSAAQRQAALNDPTQLVFLALVESHKNLNRLTELDNAHSRIAPNTDPQSKAERRPPNDVSHHYADFVVERLAIGASVLAQLWYSAWQQAGSPDLSEYQSYVYPVAPAYIPPDYLD